jgi:hypothetical protein
MIQIDAHELSYVHIESLNCFQLPPTPQLNALIAHRPFFSEIQLVHHQHRLAPIPNFKAFFD